MTDLNTTPETVAKPPALIMVLIADPDGTFHASYEQKPGEAFVDLPFAESTEAALNLAIDWKNSDIAAEYLKEWFARVSPHGISLAHIAEFLVKATFAAHGNVESVALLERARDLLRDEVGQTRP